MKSYIKNMIEYKFVLFDIKESLNQIIFNAVSKIQFNTKCIIFKLLSGFGNKNRSFLCIKIDKNPINGLFA